MSLEDVETRVGLLSRADGSASYKSKGLRLLASVNGPMEVRQRDELLGEATLELHVQPAVGLAGTAERDLERVLKAALKPALLLGLTPRALVQVTIQILADEATSAALMAACLNTAALACVDAGLAMQRVPVAVAVSLGTSTHAACYTFPARELVLLVSEGKFRRQDLKQVEKLALSAAEQTYGVLEAQIRQRVERDERWQQ